MRKIFDHLVYQVSVTGVSPDEFCREMHYCYEKLKITLLCISSDNHLDISIMPSSSLPPLSPSHHHEPMK